MIASTVRGDNGAEGLPMFAFWCNGLVSTLRLLLSFKLTVRRAPAASAEGCACSRAGAVASWELAAVMLTDSEFLVFSCAACIAPTALLEVLMLEAELSSRRRLFRTPFVVKVSLRGVEERLRGNASLCLMST